MKTRRVRFKRRRNMPLSKKQTKAVKTIAKKAIEKKAEVKVFDTTLSALTNISATTTGNVIIDFPDQSVTSAGRIGNKIDLKSLQIRGEFDCGSLQAVHGRILLVQALDSDSDGELQLRDVLQYPQTGHKMNSYFKHDSDRRFKVLSDRQYWWDSNTTSAPQPYFVDIKKFGTNTIVQEDTSTQEGNIGKIYMWALGGAGATDMDIRSLHYRFRYTDL